MLARHVLVAALAVVSPMVACRDHPADTAATGEHYRARGKIVRLSADEAEIHHETLPAIRGYDGTVAPMSSMTMPFARSGASFDGLAVGDVVELEFTIHYGSDPVLRLARIAKLPANTALDFR